jgi:hypothetical protein
LTSINVREPVRSTLTVDNRHMAGKWLKRAIHDTSHNICFATPHILQVATFASERDFRVGSRGQLRTACNSSAHPSIADMRADIDLRRCGPILLQNSLLRYQRATIESGKPVS